MKQRTQTALVTGALITGVAASLAIAATGCPSAPTAPRVRGAGNEQPRDGGTFYFHHISNVRGLDPHVSFDELSNMGIRLLFDGLLDYDHDSNLVPSIALEIPTPTNEGKTFTFRLRHGVKFHNGREVKAQDIKYSMERMLNPATGSPGYNFYMSIIGAKEFRDGEATSVSGIEVKDEYTVEFSLKQPDQTFLNAMAMTFAYPVAKEHIESLPGLDAVAQHPMGTGPFVFEEWERGVRVIFKRRPDGYWRDDQGRPDKMIFLENLTRDVAAMRFRNGDLDAVHAYSAADWVFFKNSEQWAPYRTIDPQVSIYGVFLNNEMEPFDNVHIRRAVTLAIDREEWARVKNGRIIPAGQALPPSIPGYDAELPNLQTFDLERAKEEMRLGGHPDGLDEPITMWVGESSASRAAGALMQNFLKPIGIELEIKPVAFAVYLQESGKPGSVQMAFTGWNMDFPDASNFLDTLWHQRAIHENSSENRAFYRSDEFDALLDQARINPDQNRRKQLYREASNILSRDAPWCFLYYPVQMELWQPYVHNYRPHPVWSEDYRNVWLDLPKRTADLRFRGERGLSSSFASIFFPFGGVR